MDKATIINDYRSNLLAQGYKQQGATTKLTQQPFDTDFIKAGQYFMSDDYDAPTREVVNNVEIVYVFDGFRQPVSRDDADRVYAIKMPGRKVTQLF